MSDSRELTESNGGAVAHSGGRAVSIPMEQRMSMLREALVNPDVDPAKASAMADLMWKMEDRERESEFNRAKIAAIRAMPAIYKRGQSDKHRYAKFEDLHRAVMPVLSAHDLTIDFRVGSEGNNITVQPILRHANGWTEEGGTMKGPPDQGPGRSAVQAVGSTTSYLKRHSMKAMLNIIEDGEDNDGALRADDRLNDRQARLVSDAEERAEDGQYLDWYGKLPAKDRALLVQLGIHARLGGGGALPGPDDRQADRPAQDQRQAEGGKRTPEQMVQAYEAGISACKTLDELRGYQTDPATAKWADTIKAKYPDLHQRIVDANQRRFEELSPPADDASLFGGDQ